MAIVTGNVRNGIELNLVAYTNCDDVQLFWHSVVGGSRDAPIPHCLGFMIERQRKQDNGEWAPVEILRNRVAFVDQPAPASPGDPKALSRPSNTWPFQRFEWTDHGANSGQTVRYRVSAMSLPDGGTVGETLLEAGADTGWTPEIRISAAAGNLFEAYFNRGFVMSQFVSRIARANNWTPLEIKDHIKELGEPLRRFLAGEVRLALLRLMDEVIGNPLLELYVTLYELSDKELIDRLKLLGARAHVVLANGSDKSGDENAMARDALGKAKVDVRDRLLGNKGLGHNKFLVLVRTKDQLALKVWTGSTNWAATGMCTQANNGLLIKSSDVAQVFLDQWHRLANSGNDFPDELVSENAKSPRSVGGIDVWFTRVRNKSKKNLTGAIDIEALIDLVANAKSMVLYVMFQPGAEPLSTILAGAQHVYTRGVVSTLISSNVEKFTLKGIDTQSQGYRTALIQPQGIANSFSAWTAEVVRSQFLSRENYTGIGHAITHSKMIVIDPFSDDCKVITGSHNFSVSASEQNDDNFVVVHGNKPLAEAYAVACLGTYEHYAWRAHVLTRKKAGKPVWSHLSTNASWQQSYLTVQRRDHLLHWC